MTTTYNHERRQAIANLFSSLAAIRELETIDPDNVPTHAYRKACRATCHAHTTDENPWPAVQMIAAVLRLVDPNPGPALHGEPPARSHWLRLAWLELVRAAANEAGHGIGDAPRWSRMHAGELAAEFDDIADTY
jgi:hypothetical protein